MKGTHSLIALGAIVIYCEAFHQIPPYLQVCKRSDPALNDCVQNSIEKLRPRLAVGIKDLFIPPCEPLQIPEIKLEQSSGAITVNSVYENILVYGLSRFHIRSVRIDVKRNKFRLIMWFPNLFMTASYSISGKLMLLPLQGQGVCSGNFTDIDATTQLNTERHIKNETEYLTTKDIFVKFNIGGSTIQLDNLFNGDPALGEAMNKFLNENWKSVTAEIRPTMERTIGQMLEKISSQIFDLFPYDELLPK